MKILIALIWLFLLPTIAAAEMMEAMDGKILGIELKPGRTTQIIFPLPLDTIEKKKDSGLGLKVAPKLKDMILVDANYLSTPQDVFITDIHGTRFHLVFEVKSNSTQDSMVIIKSRSSEASKSIEQVKDTPMVLVLQAMAGDKRIPGFSVQKLDKPKRIYYRDGVAVYIHRIYKSAIWTGYVTFVENTNNYPITWDVRQFNYEGLVAIGAKHDLLTRKPRLATEFLAKKYRTRMEFLVDTTSDPNDLGELD